MTLEFTVNGAEIRAREPFFRLELATASMQRAYSQPWWFEDGR